MSKSFKELALTRRGMLGATATGRHAGRNRYRRQPDEQRGHCRRKHRARSISNPVSWMNITASGRPARPANCAFWAFRPCAN